MIAVVNRLPVKEGMADQVVERFADGRGFVQQFPGFVSMEVLRSEAADEVVVITRWRDKEPLTPGSIAMNSRWFMAGAVVAGCCEAILRWAHTKCQ